jgi:fructose-bisphosphate aldolase class II
MLVNMNEVLIPAKKNQYAVGLFNAVNLELARGIISAAESTRSPVIMGTAEVLLPYGPLEEVSYYLIPMAKKASVPVVIHLDHGLSFDLCVKALDLGFTSVMYDCSTLGFEENLSAVKAICDYSHSKGITVEAEIGHVGTDEICAPADAYTDPDEAKRFAEFTGCDALAIAVGTSHGAYKFKPQLDFDRIEKIASMIDAPLVLHGGSGIPDEAIKEAIKAGIRKLNIATDVCYAFLDSVQEEANKPDRVIAVDNFMKKPIEAVKEFAKTKIRLVEADGKAKSF